VSLLLRLLGPASFLAGAQRAAASSLALGAAADPRLLDMLLAKGEMELQETMEQWKQRGHLMQLIKPELAAADPLLDIGEHMRRFADGSLDFDSFSRGYRPSELAAAARQLDAAIAAGTYKAPARLPGASAAGPALPWVAEGGDALLGSGGGDEAATARRVG
jgi:hypothetical protein